MFSSKRSLKLNLLLGFSFLCVQLFGQTEIKGTIKADSVLTVSNAPYHLTGNLTVNNGATLTIRPGSVVDLKGYTINIGSSSAGKLNADGVDFKSTGSSSEKNILFKDGGKAYVHDCSFDNVYVKIEGDAGDSLQFVSNKFYNVTYPFNVVPTRIPEIWGDINTINTIGIYGYVEEDVELPQKEYSYTLSGSLYIRNDAVFHIISETVIDLNKFSLNVGTTTAGKLEADNVYFKSSTSSDKYIYFKDGGFGSVTYCHFDNVCLRIEEDASDNINITSNDFSNVKCPMYLSLEREPVISGNITNNPFIGLFGDLQQDKTLKKHDWDYKLTGTVYVKNNAALSFETGINIDFNAYTFYAGSGTAGNLNASGVHFRNSSTSDRPLSFRDGSTGTVSNCSFDNVYIKIEEDASDDIIIENSFFENSSYPILLSPGRSPEIAGNSSGNPFIVLYGTTDQDNTLPDYDWDYMLTATVTVKGNATLTIAEGANLFLNSKQLKIGLYTTDHCSLNANGVYFKGNENNRGEIYFYKNSAGNLENCRFDQTYIKTYNASPLFSNSRFFRGKTAVEILYNDAASPGFTGNDFYNNEEALVNSGAQQLNAAGNYWGHSSGPQHENNPDGLGEVIEGDVVFASFLEEPSTGTVTGSASPQNFEFGMVKTGVRIDTAFTLTNTGDLDLMILGIKNSTSNISVRSPDRFWLLPDSSQSVPFSFTSLIDHVQEDTLVLLTNDVQNPDYEITMSALGAIDSLQINFFKILVDSFPLVKVHFTVTDQAGIPIAGISEEALNLLEEGTAINEFELITKAAQASQVAATLVIDRSGSMKGQPMRDAKNAANDLIGNLSDNDIASVISFAGGITLHTPFTSYKKTLTDAVNSIRAEGLTALYNAILAAIDTLKNQSGNKAVIVLSDGINNVGYNSPLDIVTLALRHNITIYTIGLGDEIEESALRYIATTTGGQYYFAPNSEMLSIIYRIISGNLQSNYILRYTAPEEGPVIRTLKMTIGYHGLSVTDSIKYSTEKQVIEFALNKPVFRMPEFYRNSKSYFYCMVNDPEQKLIPGQEFSFIQDRTIIIPCIGKYLGDGIFQFYIDFPEDLGISSLKFVFPDSILHYGNYIGLVNKPEEFIVYVLKPGKTETIDVFAGGSLGATLLAGAAGAGPSVAAASLSAEGTAGMGLTFEMNSQKEEYITRRFEAGVGYGVESPAINSVIGDVQAGVKAGINVKGILGQTMKFDASMTTNEKKAKTLYLLETFSLGALSLTPDCSLLKQALHLSLSQLSGGIMNAYDDLYYSEMYGLNLEGTASVGASFALNEKTKEEDQNKLNLAEVGVGVVFSGQFTDFQQNSNKELEFGMALSGGFSLLELEIMGIDMGSLYGYSFGADMSLGANFNLSSGLNAVNMNFGLTENKSILFEQKNNRREFGISVPKKVITRALNQDSLITSLLPFFNPESPKMEFSISKDHFINSAENFFKYATGPLDDVNDHVLIETSKTETFCAEIGISTEIDAALIIGGGLKLGVTLGYAEDETWPESTYTVAEGKLLPLIKHGNPVEANLLSLTDEIKFLFDNVPLLVKDLINSLIKVIDQMIEAGQDFILTSYDEACTLAGDVISSGGSLVSDGLATLASYTPSLSFPNPFKSAFLDPVIIDAYMSSRVSALNGAKFQDENPGSKFLCIVSNCYRINIYDSQDSLINEFEPLEMKIAIDPGMMQEYGFGEEEKSMAAIWFYNFDSLMWYEVPGDLHSSPDTVTTTIDRCGTYAVGILYDKANDKNPPEILNHYPADGDLYNPDSLFFARLYEPPLGSGINLAGTSLKIDNVETDALWDPINNIISFKPTTPLSAGVHSFEITASDHNGNVNSKTIVFTVPVTSVETPAENHELLVKCFPNPASRVLNVRLENCDPEEQIQLRIYNPAGQLVKEIFEGQVNDTSKQIYWNLSGENHAKIKPGTYFLRIKTANKIMIKKIVIN
jgi:VWFA-related protein